MAVRCTGSATRCQPDISILKSPATLSGIYLAQNPDMLKLLGSIAIGRLLGFGVVGIIVIYLLLRMLTG